VAIERRQQLQALSPCQHDRGKRENRTRQASETLSLSTLAVACCMLRNFNQPLCDKKVYWIFNLYIRKPAADSGAVWACFSRNTSKGLLVVDSTSRGLFNFVAYRAVTPSFVTSCDCRLLLSARLISHEVQHSQQVSHTSLLP
jgi:hypothetical protein